jgi:D-amino-acid dehydrogenase
LLRDLTLESIALHEHLAESGITTGLRRCGRLEVYATESGFASGLRDSHRYVESTGLPAQVLDRDGALELEPTLGSGIAGAIHYPDETGCDPKQFVDAVAEAAVRSGAAIRTGVELRRLRRAGRRAVLDTTMGELRPETTVLASGAWSARLLRDLGIRLSIEGGKGYSIDVVGAARSPGVPVYLAEARTIATPVSGRLRLVGMFVLDGLDPSVDPRRRDAIMSAAARGFDAGREWRAATTWCGLRPCTPDGLPVIGRPSGLDGLIIATGHGMYGLQLAPITGRLVGELAAGETPTVDLEPLHPDRFRLPLSRRRPSPADARG